MNVEEIARRAADPNEPFPEPNLKSQEQQEHIKEWVGPAGSGKAMNLSKSSPVRQGQTGGTDCTEGINRDVGQFASTGSHHMGARHMAGSVDADKMHAGTNE